MDMPSESLLEVTDCGVSSESMGHPVSQSSQSAGPSTRSLRPMASRGKTCGPRIESHQYLYCDSEPQSTNQSFGTFDSEVFFKGDPNGDNEFPYSHESHWNDALPATSRDFSELFPSSRRLEIKHDDTTSDGNLNLRVDTSVKMSRGEKRNMTLFHLRMQNLKYRDFSLRRYCRDSGRELCNTHLKPQGSSERPTSSRSFSSGLLPFKSKRDAAASVDSHLKRQDSGYDSMEVDNEEDSKSWKHQTPKSSDLISLEFSNYAHLDIKRKGIKADKHYDFEYWGARYSWRMVTEKSFGITRVSFHLLRRNDQQIVAHIVPEQLTDDESKEESEAGGWVPPCSMWISDRKVIESLPDVSDVVVATGLVVLTDDSVRRHFREKETRKFTIPIPLMPPLQMNFDHIDPKHIIHEAFEAFKHTSNGD